MMSSNSRPLLFILVFRYPFNHLIRADNRQNVLRKGPGSAVLVVPGGAAESLDAHPGTHSLTLKKRQVVPWL